MKKTMFFRCDFGHAKYWISIDSIVCIDSIDSIESEDSTDSIDSIDFIDSIDSIDAILVPHKRSPTFTPYTKGRALRARAPSVLLLFPLCVV